MDKEIVVEAKRWSIDYISNVYYVEQVWWLFAATDQAVGATLHMLGI